MKHAVMCYNEPTAVNAHRLMRLGCCTALSAHSACYFNCVLPLRAWFYELLLPWAASVARWHCKACSFHCNVRWQVFYSASVFNQSIGSWDAGRAMSLFQVEFDSRFLVCCMRHACFLSHIVYCMAYRACCMLHDCRLQDTIAVPRDTPMLPSIKWPRHLGFSPCASSHLCPSLCPAYRFAARACQIWCTWYVRHMCVRYGVHHI